MIPKTGEETTTIAWFKSDTHTLINGDDTVETYDFMKEKMLESLAKFQKRGSGWRFLRIDMLDIYITKFKPLNGKGHTPLPEKRKHKKALINMLNEDDMCFKWAATRALNPTESNPGRITKTLREHIEELNWDGLEFPVKLSNIGKFEENNGVGVNVFSADEDFKVYPLRLTKLRTESSCVNLFLSDTHYSIVKDLIRLVGAQVSGKEHRKHVCVHCLNVFGTSELLQQHTELCLNNEHMARNEGQSAKCIAGAKFH